MHDIARSVRYRLPHVCTGHESDRIRDKSPIRLTDLRYAHRWLGTLISRLVGTQLRRNVVSGVIVAFANASLMIVAYRTCLGYLGYEEYGLWLALATVLNCAYFGNLGVSAAVTKFVAEGQGRDDREFIERHVINAVFLLCAVGGLCLLATTVFRHQIVDVFRLTGESRRLALRLLPWIGSLMAYLLMTHILNAILAGLGRLDATNYIQTGGRVIGIAVTIVLLWLGYGIGSLVLGYLTSYVVMHVASVAYIKKTRCIHLLRVGYFDIRCMKRLLCFGGQYMAGQSLQLLMHPFNKCMLSRSVGVAAIPVYEIAYAAAMMLRSFVETGLRALFPEISRLSADPTHEARARILSLNSKVQGIVMLIALPAYACMIVLAPAVFAVWLRQDLSSLMPRLFQVMAVGTLLSLFGASSDNTLLGLGLVRQCLWARVLQAAVNVTVVFSLAPVIPGKMMLAVALAVTCAWLSWFLYVMWARRRYVTGPQ
jgi:O-antigen/teichoic acid export membrane protein